MQHIYINIWILYKYSFIYIYVYRYNLASKYLHRRPRPICFFHRDLAERCPRLVAASSWFYLEGRTTIVWQQSNNNPEKDQYEGFNQHKWVFNMNQLDPSKRGISYIYIYIIFKVITWVYNQWYVLCSTMVVPKFSSNWCVTKLCN